MKIKEIISVLEEMAPLAYAEDFDNVGLLVGNQESEATGILVCHDALENIIDEAITKNCNMVVCFHPILFSWSFSLFFAVLLIMVIILFLLKLKK